MNIFTIRDDISGIRFEGNLLRNERATGVAGGFTAASFDLVRQANGLLQPVGDIEAGVSKNLAVLTRDDTGVSWYAKQPLGVAFDSGRVIDVAPRADALANAVKAAHAGDILALAPGDYDVSHLLTVSVPITVRAKKPVSNGDPAESGVFIRYSRSALFEIANGGSLKLAGLNVSGADTPDNVGNAVVRTSKYAMLVNYDLLVEQCSFTALDKNHSFNFLSVSKGTFANRIELKDSRFDTVTGAVLALDRETDDYGIYNAEYLVISGSSFRNIQGPLVNFYRGGTDESTFGPHFRLAGSSLENVGLGRRNKGGASVLLHGVQDSRIEGTVFEGSAPVIVNHTVGEPQTRIVNNIFRHTGVPVVTELNSGTAPTAQLAGNRVEGN